MAQLVRAPPCHGGGRGFEPHPDRHYSLSKLSCFASVAQSVEQGTENPRVDGSIPSGGTKKCGCSSSGRAPPCQGGGSEFEPRFPLSLVEDARMVESVDTRDLKSLGHCGCAGSSPASSTRVIL